MTQNRLFKQLCCQKTMLFGWYLAQADSRDNFVLDPVGYVDFASNLNERLQYLMEQVQAYRYRPRHLLDIDIPKSGLSVRPGNVIPIEESILLHAIIYLLAPMLDKKLDESVYSYRLHPDWKKRIKKRDSLFRESRIDLPFLKRATIRSLSPFDAWYERWPEFEKAAVKACTLEGYTHLTKTDITAYFENIDLRLLETQIRLLLKREEDKIIQLLFRILDGWTRITSTGTPVGRGIPQGNEVSSFLGNIYLIPLDRELIKFCRRYKAKWFRYVDDVKVFTRTEKDARQAVFVINDALRALHLNLQGSKTEILADKELKDELDNIDLENVETVFKNIERIDPHRPTNAKRITMHLQGLRHYVSRLRRNPQTVVKNLKPKQNRLFRRLMTIYGFCGRPHLKRTAMAALKELPDMRILDKALLYLSQLEYATHDETIDQLFGMLETGQLPFPYQIGSLLETIAMMHPQSPQDVASRARKYGLAAKQHWFVTAKALEVISVKNQSHRKLFENIKALLHEARNAIARNINTAMVMTYFDIGRMIVVDEQQGKRRAGYAEETLKSLSLDLTREFGKGFSERNLENMRKFYLLYSSKISHKTFPLSWSHYVFLIRLPENEKNFYEIEAMKRNWSLRELERQFNSSLYERLALSRDKKKVRELSEKGHVLAMPQDAIKEPYVLEFLGLKEESAYSENDLECAIITRIEHFMLELGKGFLFAGRQVRFSFDEDHYYVDLVFYNRLLKCFVLIDLKIGKLKHQDLGQIYPVRYEVAA